MLFGFNLYDVFVLSFVQLIVGCLLILSPAREIGTRFRWTGSRVTEVLLASSGAAAVTAFSGFVTEELWGMATQSLETAAYFLAIFTAVVIVLRPTCNFVGNLFYAAFMSAGFAFVLYAAVVAAAATDSIGQALTSSLLIVLEVSALIVWSSNIAYVSDVLSRTRHSRPLPRADRNYKPMVSIHIPAYNEPPELLIETIKAVERMDYPNFEIVVVDNNTKDPAVYKPVEAYCRDRQRVKFVHVAPWPGYKAGACNLALREYTDPSAEIIGLVDADDIVQPYYLKETVPYFSDPSLGFVQTNEGNRDYEGSAYYTACVDSYQAFYLAVMSSRNERDTVPFVGTMGLFRKSALMSLGGWNEWCISEDTEASLRVLKAGWSGLYVPRCFGRGIVPPTFAGLNTQRHRWCFGAMQILRLHWRSLMPWDRSPDNHMTPAQRRDYLMACLGWTRDLTMLMFSLLLLTITGLWLSGSKFALTPLAGAESLLPLALICAATVCLTWTLHYWTPVNGWRAVRSLIVSLSACFITARACVEGMTRREGVFLRTLKTGASTHRIRNAFRLSRWELGLTAALFASAALLSREPHPPVLLIAIIAIQGTVFFCSPIASFWNVFAQRVPSVERRRRFEAARARWAGGQVRISWRLANLVIGLVLAVAISAGVAAISAPGRVLPKKNAPSVVRHRVSHRHSAAGSVGQALGRGTSAKGGTHSRLVALERLRGGVSSP